MFAKLSDFSPVGGGADDIVAVQALLNSGASDIWIDPGDWCVAGTLTVPSSVRHIHGPGTLVELTLNANLFDINGHTTGLVVNVAMHGTATLGITNTLSNNSAVNIRHSKNFSIVGCRIERFAYRAFRVLDCENFWIERNNFIECGNAVYLTGCKRWWVENNIIDKTCFAESTFTVGLAMEGVHQNPYGVCRNGRMRGNSISGFVNAQGILAHAGEDVTIAENFIDGATLGIGITAHMSPDNTGDMIQRLQVLDNTILCPSSHNHTSAGEAGITLMGGNASSQGGTTPPPRDCRIAGNTVQNANRAAKNGSFGGIVVDGNYRLSVLTNKIIAPQCNGLVVRGWNPNLVVKQNDFIDVLAHGGIKNMILMSGTYSGDMSGNYYT